MTVDTVYSTFITQNPKIRGILKLIPKISFSKASILIQGESGTGKEVLAKIIHTNSPRKDRPLVSINCGALQESLLLSELFGHERGAFTGAVTLRKGLVEMANHGTLFLDEIGEMGLEAQSKLLRFLQEEEIFRVGGKQPIKLDVRIVCATNKNLWEQVKSGQFREDLYYRINTVTLLIPPLRNRTEDIEPLFTYFLNHPVALGYSLNEESLAILKKYPWPGNVRELKNIVERLKLFCDQKKISAQDIQMVLPKIDLDLVDLEGRKSLLLSEVEKKHILKVLQHFHGNKTRAADAMGITVKTLYNKLSQFEKQSSLKLPI